MHPGFLLLLKSVFVFYFFFVHFSQVFKFIKYKDHIILPLSFSCDLLKFLILFIMPSIFTDPTCQRFVNLSFQISIFSLMILSYGIYFIFHYLLLHFLIFFLYFLCIHCLMLFPNMKAITLDFYVNK